MAYFCAKLGQAFFAKIISIVYLETATCGWSNWFTLTKFTRRQVGFLDLYNTEDQKLVKKDFSSTSVEDIAIFQISWKIQRGDPSMTKKISVSDFDKIHNKKSLFHV